MDNYDDSFKMTTNNVPSRSPAYEEGYTLHLNQEEYALGLTIPLTVIYIAIFIVGVLGNATTCMVIAKNKMMHTATNYYLFSLAISDLILLLCGLPFEIQKMWNPTSYPFGESLCITIGLSAETAANATVLSIMMLTIERYTEICHPLLSNNKPNLSKVVKIIITIWVIALFTAVPQAMQFEIESFVEKGQHMSFCTVKGVGLHEVFVISSFVFFIIPISIMGVLYVLIGIQLRSWQGLNTAKRLSIISFDRNRQEQYRNTVSQKLRLRMLFAVALSFLICWAPFHAQRLLAIYGIGLERPTDTFYKVYVVLTCMSGVLYFLTTAINPVLYSIMSKNFRNALKRTVASWCEERPPKYQTYNTLLAAEREQINGREAERARARRLHAFVIAAEIHEAPPRAQRYNKRNVPAVFELSSSRGNWSRDSRFGHNEPSDSVESRVTISNSRLREVSL